MEQALNTANLFENTPEMNPMMELIEAIMNLNEDVLNDSVRESIVGMVNGALSPSVRKESVAALVKNFEDQNYTRGSAQEAVAAAKKEFYDIISEIKPSTAKKELLEDVFKSMFEIFDTALAQYHGVAFTLPIKLDEGAKIPTYAHDTDAAADLYAADTITIPAHSIGTMVRTGVHIQLPEGWMAMIFPRSSIGAKTGLRLSNSAGIIDQAYLGQLGVLYDNISDSDYTINAGDRIAQLLIMPSYQFKAQVVDELVETDRSEGGFGSTGK